MMVLTNRWVIGAAIVLVAVAGAYVKGRADGKAIAAGQVIRDLVETNKEWNNALSEAERLDAYDRCLAIGGLPDDCGVLLRNQPSATGQ